MLLRESLRRNITLMVKRLSSILSIFKVIVEMGVVSIF
ncbi:hypothetical protein Ccrd_010267 [Cynara cardunculus var. scolymus]|uniref:Uncharacterized protein n=1 Tax=Cynara cardunculus var. scolymus TaxID=59895 RepID=A0A124SI24_CYNCS|nr:hypothetical protein Ccrd_010267 [Cynara cardunculus var. scolymus]